MGIYFNPPAPTQAAPHTPIAAQPAAPPNRAASLLPILGAIAIAWIPPPAQPTQLAQRYIPPPVTYLAPSSLIAFLANQTPQQVWGTQYPPKIPIPLQPSNPPGFQPQQVSLKWPQPDWLSQTFADNAAWNNVAAFLPFARQQVSLQWPQPTWGTQELEAAPIGVQPVAITVAPKSPPALSWPQAAWPAQTYADNAGWNIPLGIAPYSTVASLALTVGTWPQPIWNSQTLPTTAGLQPQPSAPPVFTVKYPGALQWPQPAWSAQTFGSNASWNIQISTAPFVQMQVAFQWPQPTWGSQTLPATRILAQPPGNLFMPSAPQALSWPQPTWAAQTFADNAAWSTIPVFMPLAPSQVSVNAWPPISWAAQRGPAGVTLLPPHADQPPRYSISGTMALRLQWPELIWGASHFVSAADIPPGAQGTGKNQFLSGNIAFNLISGLITGSFRSGNN